MSIRTILVTASLAAAFAQATPALAQPFDATPVSLTTSTLLIPPPLAAPPPDDAAATASDDMAMPDDLGAPLGAPPPATAPATGRARAVSINSPIAQIVAAPGGRAILDQELPGLCERPEYSIFKGMSLVRLAKMSSGRISEAKLQVVEADLTRINPVVGR